MTIEQILKGAENFEDGETGTNRCIDLFCESVGFTDDALIESAKRQAFTSAALEAGIPLSVIQGKTKLSDHFPQPWIDHMIGKRT